jgi:vacuolar-type H+-ATPase subunit H
MGEDMGENNANAPLDLIRSKERKLAQLIKDAENRAKEKLAAARARAKAIRQEAEITGQREAEQFFHDEMTGAQQAAAVINDASTGEAEQVTRRGEKHLDRAGQIVIDFIFPK